MSLFHFRVAEVATPNFLTLLHIYGLYGVKGWRSGESTRLPPMWPGFDSQIRSEMWAEIVGSLLCTERFSPGTPVSPLLKKPKKFDLIVLIVNLSYSVPN